MYDDTKRDKCPQLLLLTSACGKQQKNKTNVCVRSVTSTSWWSSDPWLAAELVSWSLHGSDWSFAGRPDSRGGEGSGGGSGDLDWLSNNQTLGVPCCFVSTSSPPVHAAPFSKRLKTRKKRLWQAEHCTQLSMSSILKLYLYVLYIHVSVFVVASWLLQKRNNTNMPKQARSAELVTFAFL